jgi:hypothetical protein
MSLSNESFSLSPELLKAVNPEASVDAQVKFDDKGTMHILNRDKSGKLIKDYALQHVQEQQSELYESAILRVNEIHEKTKYYKFLFILILIFLGALTSIALVIIHAYGII